MKRKPHRPRRSRVAWALDAPLRGVLRLSTTGAPAILVLPGTHACVTVQPSVAGPADVVACVGPGSLCDTWSLSLRERPHVAPARPKGRKTNSSTCRRAPITAGACMCAPVPPVHSHDSVRADSCCVCMQHVRSAAGQPLLSALPPTAPPPTAPPLSATVRHCPLCMGPWAV